MFERQSTSQNPEKNLSKAKDFYELHVREYSESEFDAYQSEVVKKWKEDAHNSIAEGESICPMWMRRNEGGGTFWGACIDYMMPVGGELRVFATIDIYSDGNPAEIDVWFPKDDESGEPIVTTSERYSLETLDRALELVETTVRPVKH